MIVTFRNGDNCMAPASSVLFDGIIPFNNWARQLLAFYTSGNTLSITFIFMSPTSVNGTRIPYIGVTGIEVVMFNCPSRYHATTASIVVKDNTGGIIEDISIADYVSCDHLIRIGTSNNFYTSSSEITLEFTGELGPSVYLIYLAEVTFYSNHDNHYIVGPITTPRST